MGSSKTKKKKARRPSRQTVPIFSANFHTGTKFYRANLAALQQHYPELARRVAQCPFTARYRVQPSLRKDGTPNLYCAEKDFLYYDNTDPLRDAERQLAALQLKNVRLALCCGVGLGYEVIHFVNDLANAMHTQALIIIEKDLELFKLACCYTNLTPSISNQNTFFLVGADPDALYVPLKNKIKNNNWYILLRTLKAIYHPSSLHLDKDYYLAALRTLNQAGLHAVNDFGNCPEDSLIGIENMLANLPLIISNPGINRLFGNFRNKPAVVIATGPSLNKNKHLLKGLEQKALLISVDASLKLLLEMGIRPHLVTSLERVILVNRFFENIPPEALSETYLAACPVIRREVYDLYHGPKVIVYRNLDHFKWLQIERGILDIKASAGNMAFKIAAALGCNPIILVGQDLAFDRAGATHASGHALGEKQESFYRDLLTVPGNDGQPIQTSQTLYSFLKGYEMDLAEYEGTCINATEGGAFIQGTKIMPLAEAIGQYIHEAWHPLTVIRSHLNPPDPAETEKDLRQVLANIDRTGAELERIADVCKASLLLIEETAPQLQRDNAAQVREFLNQVEDQKRNCAGDYHTYQLFFAHVIQSFSIQFEMAMQAIPENYPNETEALAEIALRHREWFSTIEQLSITCRAALLKYRELLSFSFPDSANG